MFYSQTNSAANFNDFTKLYLASNVSKSIVYSVKSLNLICITFDPPVHFKIDK